MDTEKELIIISIIMGAMKIYHLDIILVRKP